MITVDDFVLFCDRTSGGIAAVATCLGDDRLNQQSLPGASTPYQLATHALAAAEYWCAHIICGHPTTRVRDDEFVAAGTAADVERQVAALMARLRELAPELAAAKELAHSVTTETPLGRDWTVGAALIHAYEELAQHLGHLELMADVLLADG